MQLQAYINENNTPFFVNDCRMENLNFIIKIAMISSYIILNIIKSAKQ